MLLIYHLDAAPDVQREIYNKELRLELGFFPKATQRITLKMVGFAHDKDDAYQFLQFPDVRTTHFDEEKIDAASQWDIPGIGFSAQYGQPDSTRGSGHHSRGATTIATDLDLGFMDPQKDYFRVIADTRFGIDDSIWPGWYNNISIVFEVHDVSTAT